MAQNIWTDAQRSLLIIRDMHLFFTNHVGKNPKVDNILCEAEGKRYLLYCRWEGKMVQTPKGGDLADSSRDVDL